MKGKYSNATNVTMVVQTNTCYGFIKRTNMKESDLSVQNVIMRPHREATCSFTDRRSMMGLFMLAVSAIIKPAQKEALICTGRQSTKNILLKRAQKYKIVLDFFH